MKKQAKSLLLFIGIAVLAAGLLTAAFFPDANGVMRHLPAVLIGFGVGLIVPGAIFMVMLKGTKKNPEKARQLEIDEKDERNIRLREKAGFTAWFITLFVIVVLLLTFLLIDNETGKWLALAALFIHVASYRIFYVIYKNKY
ncbi:MAG: hypothetical protein FWD78_14715 [Treponema sp.]|nr:hypothetical protein [Treponema sp.]